MISTGGATGLGLGVIIGVGDGLGMAVLAKIEIGPKKANPNTITNNKENSFLMGIKLL